MIRSVSLTTLLRNCNYIADFFPSPALSFPLLLLIKKIVEYCKIIFASLLRSNLCKYIAKQYASLRHYEAII